MANFTDPDRVPLFSPMSGFLVFRTRLKLAIDHSGECRILAKTPRCVGDYGFPAEPMRGTCEDLSVTSLPSGHWLPLERKAESIQAIRSWLKTKRL